ncbi:receptor-like protein EIX2 [Bidens hawaiensis]|uniref:receptor-like protein EIX2 n=1 Tax=Bidens hawaiensis TaxID=980011 RepID=UPI00404AE7A7
METSFLLIFAFLFFQTFSLSSNTMPITSSNVTCIARERRSLLVLKQTLTDRFNLLSTWRGVECCEWHGVGCDRRNGHVVKLDFRSSNFRERLAGELSPSLQDLKYMRSLDLSVNHFSGTIPEFLGSFVHLEYLNLTHSGFSGVVPHHLGNLSRLQYLDLSHGPLMDNLDHRTSYGYDIGVPRPVLDDLGWMSSLRSLRHLDLSYKSLEGIDWFHPLNMLPSLLTLNLESCNIVIPSAKFANFTSVSSLDLSFNFINSTIPVWLSNLTNLMHLDLKLNEFHGEIPDHLGTFSALTSIDLSSNYFETLIPDMLCNLSNLVRLDLSGNKFYGPVPAKLGLLSGLEDLALGDNPLNGSIPLSLGQLSKLKNLDLSSSSLVGVLTETHFTKLKNLNHLELSESSLALNFSSRWIAPFQLQIFNAKSCQIGPHFPNWLQTQKNLRSLNLFNSSIRDTIPEWFENILSRILDLDLSNNQISGKLPRFHFESSSDQIIDGVNLFLNSNKFEGSLAAFPENLYILDLSDNLLSGHVPQTNGTMNPSLQVVNLSKNRFTGNFPAHLCKVPNIQLLDLSQNNFYGRLPGGLGNLTSLIVIDLSNNSITGVVPSSLGSLTSLSSLHLHNNFLEGNIPVSLQNLTRLVTMDLGNNLFMGTIPFWIGENLSEIKFLNLESNKFTGKIPLHFCQLNNLQFLSLSRNNITGSIPRCLGNLSGMITDEGYIGYIGLVHSYDENIWVNIKGGKLLYTKTMRFLTSLDLSGNYIVGEIPHALMKLVKLNNLKLSGNLLKGHIPINIGDLKQLESLDLSMNKLSGRIPQSLTSLNFLSYLNLSFNNLSGAIPVGNQLRTLDDPSIYEGNSGLCGPQVPRSCNENDVTYNHVGDGDDGGQDDSNEGLWFYAGMGPGFVVGFIGLLGSLHFIRRWRVFYFETLENVYGWLVVSILLNIALLRRNVFK